MSLLEKKLTKDWALKVIPPEKKMFGAILHDLQNMANIIMKEMDLKGYTSPQEFIDAHDRGGSPLEALEGSSARDGHVFVLKKCPMGKLVESLKEDGKLPKYYLEVVKKYVELYKSKGAIIHPFCIVHQVIREQVGESIKVNGGRMLVYQVACRSLASGKVVYATEGTSRVDMTQEAIDKKIDGNACMYLVKF